jgi:hypothetical protein
MPRIGSPVGAAAAAAPHALPTRARCASAARRTRARYASAGPATRAAPRALPTPARYASSATSCFDSYPSASATSWLYSAPSCVLTPFDSGSLARTASIQPLSAICST